MGHPGLTSLAAVGVVAGVALVVKRLPGSSEASTMDTRLTQRMRQPGTRISGELFKMKLPGNIQWRLNLNPVA